MSPLVVALVLTAALLHAAWNAILRGGRDRLWSITVMTTVGAVAAIPLAVVFPPPARQSWPYLVGSAGLQVGYCLFLVRAYRTGLLAQVYPIARGSAPLLVTVGAWLLAREQIGGWGLVGVVLVSGGIMALALGRDRPDAASTGSALIAGGFIASYMVADGLGVRHSASVLGYIAWQALAQGLAMALTFWAIRKRLPAWPRLTSDKPVIVAALIGCFAYGVVVWAMSLGAMGKVSALRETSILFAALIGAALLKEPLTVRRACGGIAVGLGAILLSAS